MDTTRFIYRDQFLNNANNRRVGFYFYFPQKLEIKHLLNGRHLALINFAPSYFNSRVTSI